MLNDLEITFDRGEMPDAKLTVLKVEQTYLWIV